MHLTDAQLSQQLVELGRLIGRQKTAGVVENQTREIDHQAPVTAAELGLSSVEEPVQDLGYDVVGRRAPQLAEVLADLLLGWLLVGLGHEPTVPLGEQDDADKAPKDRPAGV